MQGFHSGTVPRSTQSRVRHDYYRYTEHALRRFCEVAGLHVEHLEPYGGTPEILMELASKNIVFSKLLTRAMARFFGRTRRRGLRAPIPR